MNTHGQLHSNGTITRYYKHQNTARSNNTHRPASSILVFVWLSSAGCHGEGYAVSQNREGIALAQVLTPNMVGS